MTEISPIYVAYYTVDTPYEEEIKKLITSLKKFNLPYDLQGVASLGSWQENTKFKAIFIQNMLFKHQNRPIVYVDADAVIRNYPLLFDTLNCDIAVHYYDDKRHAERELLSGTLYFGATEKAKKIVEFWRTVNRQYPHQWEQKNLALALRFMPDLTVVELPSTYCQIFDLMRGAEEAVIEHFQASRRYKQIIDREGSQSLE